MPPPCFSFVHIIKSYVMAQDRVPMFGGVCPNNLGVQRKTQTTVYMHFEHLAHNSHHKKLKAP